MSMVGGNQVVVACEKYWEQYKGDCSGFVKAVALELGVTLIGQANDIVNQIGSAPWVPLTTGADAAIESSLGLVVAGLKDNPNGHVAIVVPGPLAHGKYPTAYWGKLGDVGKKNTTLNWAWSLADRDKVSYSCMAGGNRVVVACEKHWEQYKGDCGGFVKAVALELGVTLIGQANDIVDQIGSAPWVPLSTGIDAAIKSGLGLVVAGLKDNPHGHVVIVVPGPLADGKYPTAYWGELCGVGKKNTTLNWAWSAADQDNVSYSWRSL